MSTTSQFGYITAITDPNPTGTNSFGLGTSVAGSGVTVQEFGNAKRHVTVFDFGTPSSSTTTISPGGAGAQNLTIPLYVIPESAAVNLNSGCIDIKLQAAGATVADTPYVGLGWIVGTSATLGNIGEGNPVVGQAADCNGTPLYAITATNAYGIEQSSSARTLRLNVRATWAGADTITISGKVSVQWTTLK